MEFSTINNSDDLSHRILQLREARSKQGDELKDQFNTFTDSLNPLGMIKKSIHELVEDREVKDDLLKAGLKLGSNFIIEKVMDRQSVKGYLSTIIVERISSSIIQGGVISDIYFGLTGLFNSDLRKESSAETDK